MIPASIFREYDIRGLADCELTDSVSTGIGKAFATVLLEEGKKAIAVGHDLRPSSERIRKALIGGLLSTGAEVIDLGLIPTPLLYFSVSHEGFDAGISITGSHNPVEYNGFKFHLSDRPFYGREIQELRLRIETGRFAEGKGSSRSRDIVASYREDVQGRFRFQRRLRVVLDCGHGMAGLLAPALVRHFGHEVFALYENLDPAFPDHHPDPTVLKNLTDLQKEVLERKADLGIAFDGDADRIGVVDEKGQVIFGDRVLLLFARGVLREVPGATVIGDVKCSQVLYDDIRRHGGVPIMWKTGHSLIKAKMKESGAALAGEMSGHMFFAHRWYGFDDGLYAALRMVEVVDRASQPLSAMLADLPALVSTPEIRLDCPDDLKFRVVGEAVRAFKKKGYRVLEIDGARVEFEDGWGLVRASNTQPVLVMRFEAQNERRLKEIQSLIEAEVKAVSKKA